MTHRQLCAERDPEQWAALNVVFHRELTRSTPDGRPARIVTNLAEAAGACVTLSMHPAPEFMASNNADRADRLRHYQSGDAEAAARETAKHLEHTLRAIEENVQARLTGPGPGA